MEDHSFFFRGDPIVLIEAELEQSVCREKELLLLQLPAEQQRFLSLECCKSLCAVQRSVSP